MTPKLLTEEELEHWRDLTHYANINCRDAVFAHIAALTERLRGTLGAMVAQDERERRAGERCGVPYETVGSDWPDWVAEKVLELQVDKDRLDWLCAGATYADWERLMMHSDTTPTRFRFDIDAAMRGEGKD